MKNNLIFLTTFLVYTVIINPQQASYIDIDMEINLLVSAFKEDIRGIIDKYFFDGNTNNLNNDLRPPLLNDYEKMKDDGYAPIIINLKIVCSDNIDKGISKLIKDEMKANWDTADLAERLLPKSSLYVNYVSNYELKYIAMDMQKYFQIAKNNEKTKLAYSSVMTIQISQLKDTLLFDPRIALYSWSLTDSVRPDKIAKKTEDLPRRSMISKRLFTPLPPVPDTVVIEPPNNIDEFQLAENFYNLIDTFLINKDKFIYTQIKNKPLELVKNYLNSAFQQNSGIAFYILPSSYNLFTNIFSKYLSQNNLKKIAIDNLYNQCKTLFLNDTSYLFKYDYFLKNGTQKTGKYRIRGDYRNLLEYRNLPNSIQELFNDDFVEAKNIIKPCYHALAVKDGKLLNMSLVSLSSLDDLLLALRMYEANNREIWYDIIEFFSRYSTALITQNQTMLKGSWYTKAIRITKYNQDSSITITNHDISRRIMQLWKDRDTWVDYYLLKDSVTNRFDPRVFCWSSAKSVGFEEVFTYEVLNKKPNIMVLFELKQNWFNFKRNSNLLTYASIDPVNFIINIFNLKLIREGLMEKIELQPDDYFGLMIYLKHIFNDDENQSLTSKYKTLPVIKKFLIIDCPDVPNIPSFIKSNFTTSFLNQEEKQELLNFFKSPDYKWQHLEHDLFHQAYIQIIKSHTKPSSQYIRSSIDDKFKN